MAIKSFSSSVKPSLFVASSSKGLNVAKQVKHTLKKYADVVVWNSDVFVVNKSYLSSLLDFSAFYDFAIIVFTADDILEKDGKKYNVPRDNVIFELGLFLGRLGTKRAFVLCEKDIQMFSDYHGITTLLFQKNNRRSIRLASLKMRKPLLSFAHDYTVSMLPSTVLAIGYYKNFLEKIIDALIHDKPIKIIDKINNHEVIEKPVRYRNFSIKILLPTKLSQLESLNHTTRTMKFKKITLEADSRPFPFYIQGKITFGKKQKLSLFDIPTTLLSSLWTINRVFDEKFLKEDNHFKILQKREIINFERTLRAEIKDHLEDVSITFGKLNGRN